MNGHVIIAGDSGHGIHWEQPTLVLDAVRLVITIIRTVHPLEAFDRINLGIVKKDNQ